MSTSSTPGTLRSSSTTAPRCREDATALVVDNLGLIARFSARPDGQERTIAVHTTGPERDFALHLSADGVDSPLAHPGRSPT